MVGTRPEGTESTVNQISFVVPSLEDLRAANKRLMDDGIETTPINHGNAWSVYFRDPEGNRIEVFVDSPWYVEQPLIEPLDLSQTDDEIHERTKVAYGGSDTFQPLEDWKAEFGEKLKAAGLSAEMIEYEMEGFEEGEFPSQAFRTN